MIWATIQTENDRIFEEIEEIRESNLDFYEEANYILLKKAPTQSAELFFEEEAAVKRAKNNYFMARWRLLFEVAPKEAKRIQSLIRKGDEKICNLNKRLK
jgi:hypothetical protein